MNDEILSYLWLLYDIMHVGDEQRNENEDEEVAS